MNICTYYKKISQNTAYSDPMTVLLLFFFLTLLKNIKLTDKQLK